MSHRFHQKYAEQDNLTKACRIDHRTYRSDIPTVVRYKAELFTMKTFSDGTSSNEGSWSRREYQNDIYERR